MRHKFALKNGITTMRLTYVIGQDEKSYLSKKKSNFRKLVKALCHGLVLKKLAKNLEVI